MWQQRRVGGQLTGVQRQEPDFKAARHRTKAHGFSSFPSGLVVGRAPPFHLAPRHAMWLSGSSTPMESMPDWLRVLMLVDHAGAAFRVFRTGHSFPRRRFLHRLAGHSRHGGHRLGDFAFALSRFRKVIFGSSAAASRDSGSGTPPFAPPKWADRVFERLKIHAICLRPIRWRRRCQLRREC